MPDTAIRQWIAEMRELEKRATPGSIADVELAAIARDALPALLDFPELIASFPWSDETDEEMPLRDKALRLQEWEERARAALAKLAEALR